MVQDVPYGRALTNSINHAPHQRSCGHIMMGNEISYILEGREGQPGYNPMRIVSNVPTVYIPRKGECPEKADGVLQGLQYLNCQAIL